MSCHHIFHPHIQSNFKITFFPIKNVILILEYSENTKAHKMRIKITPNSAILSNQILWLFGIFLYFKNICARFSCSRNFVTCLLCLNHEQFSMSLYIIQKHVFNDCIKSQSPAVLWGILRSSNLIAILEHKSAVRSHLFSKTIPGTSSTEIKHYHTGSQR